MTATLPDWSPLNDPQLQAQIQAGLRQQRESERAHAQRDLYFLERYAWQEYPVKCGRWHNTEDGSALTSGTTVSGPWTKHVWVPDVRCVLLLDPNTRQPIAAHTVPWWSEQRAGGTGFPVDPRTPSVWFAGDPRACGMFTPAGNGHQAVFGFRVGKAGLAEWDEGPGRFERAVPLLAAQPYDDSAPRDFGPWVVDHPQPPPAPKRFGLF